MPRSTYHLWIKPTGDAYAELRRVIADLAMLMRAPAFEPHVTVLSDLPGGGEAERSQVRAIASRRQPFRVTLVEPGQTREYFRCLFMTADRTPELMACRAHAEQIFGGRARPFEPHLSLLYGTFPETRVRALADSLPAGVRTSFVVDALVLLEARSEDPKDWQEVAAFPFASRSGEASQAGRC